VSKTSVGVLVVPAAILVAAADDPTTEVG
jgi:hypothetical protein